MDFSDENALVDAVIAKVGKEIKLGIPLGIGKPNHVVNAFYRRAKSDPSIHLTILTALSLKLPTGKSFLEKRFLDPFVQRVFGDYPDLEYEVERARLPRNVQVIEFYFAAGAQLKNPSAQQNYISCNYTHAARDLIDRGVNVIAQLVAPSGDGKTYSLSCNPDVTLDIVTRLEKSGDRPFAFVGQVNRELPYLYGDAVVAHERFHFVLDHPKYQFRLFGPPKRRVSPADYLIGLYASTLVKDGGTLQVGIGSLSDALIFWLLLRHQNNALYLKVLESLGITERYKDLIRRCGDTGPFTKGLFGSTEMMVDGFMDLFEAGILKREVQGTYVHAGFFVGPQRFYRWLRELPEEKRRRIRMNSVSTINQLYGHEDIDRRELTHARFINTCLMMTLSGAAVSDGLEDGRVVSGVGGQYNFVAMAHALEDARSILQLRSTRTSSDGLVSNIVFNYGHITIPRHLRDIVITEYGIAELRGKTDAEVATELLQIADSSFQPALSRSSQSAGKLPESFHLENPYGENTAKSLRDDVERLRPLLTLPPFPFGTDLTDDELTLSRVLKTLKDRNSSTSSKIPLFARAAIQMNASKDEERLLARLSLSAPSSLEEHLYRRLVLTALRG